MAYAYQTAIRMCFEHANKELKIYCFNCGKAICFTCSREEHAEHKCDDISSAAREIRSTMLERCKNVRELDLKHFDTLIQDLEENCIFKFRIHDGKIESIRADVFEKINEVFKEERERVSRKKNVALANIREEQIKLKGLYTDVKESNENMERDFKLLSDFDVLEMNEELKDKVEKMRRHTGHLTSQYLLGSISCSKIVPLQSAKDFKSISKNLFRPVGGTMVVAAAIDFGKMTCFAFSLISGFSQRPLSISTQQFNDPDGQLSVRRSTSILFDESMVFHSFGFEADEKHQELVLEGKDKDWFYFQNFNKILYHEMEEEMVENMTVFDVNARQMNAIAVLSAAISYCKECIMGIIGTHIDDESTLWTFTVPYLPKDTNRRLLWKAAENAGIIPENVIMVSHEEAAYTYCKYKYRDEKRKEDHSKDVFVHQSTFLLVDAGGDRSYLHTLEKEENGHLKRISQYELHTGGNAFNRSLLGIIEAISDEDAMVELKTEESSEYRSLLRCIERKKNTMKRDMKKIRIQIPQLLLEGISETLQQGNTSEDESYGKMELKGPTLTVDASMFLRDIEAVCAELIEQIEEVLRQPCSKSVAVILMVGEFSVCSILQDAVKSKFSNLQVIIVDEPDLARCKGAVLMGHEENLIR